MPDIKAQDIILVRTHMKRGDEVRLARVNLVKDNGDDTITINYVPCYEDVSKHGIDRTKYLDMGSGGMILPRGQFVPEQYGWQEITVVCNLGFDPDLKWYRDHQAAQRAMYKNPGYDPMM